MVASHDLQPPLRREDDHVEKVNHPQHYGGDTTYEVIKVLKAWLTPEEYIGFLKGNVIKYDARSAKKGSMLEDVRKAQWYQNELAVALAEFCKEKKI